MKIYHLLVYVVFSFLIVGCNKTEIIPSDKGINIPAFEDIRFNGNFYCSPEINWPEIAAAKKGESYGMDMKKDYVPKWVEERFQYDKNIEECINTRADTTCLLLYAMINNKPELCEHFPEKKERTFFSPPSMGSGQGGGDQTETCYYRDMCYAFVKIRNE